MKLILKNRRKFIILLVIAGQLVNISCSRKIFPEQPFQKIESQSVRPEKTGRNNTKSIYNSDSQGDNQPIEINNENQTTENLNANLSDNYFTSRDENLKLEGFINSGTEKRVNTLRISAEEIIETAQKYYGVPHCTGGTTATCMDCSGLLVTVFASHGIQLPRNSQAQARYGKIIPRIEDLKKGDLVFFTRSYITNNFITHSGIYAGDNKFIHASSKRGVTITSMYNPWWHEKFIFGTRVLESE